MDHQMMSSEAAPSFLELYPPQFTAAMVITLNAFLWFFYPLRLHAAI